MLMLILSQMRLKMKKNRKKYNIPSKNLCFITKNFLSTGLPMRPINEIEFRRYNNRVSTCMLAPSHIGLPYGMIPRQAIIAMVTYIKRTEKQTMPIGTTNREHFEALGIQTNTSGRILKYKNKQLNALLNCAFYVTKINEDGESKTIRFFIAKENSIDHLNHVQSITFSDEFYHYVLGKNNAVPLDRCMLAQFARSPLCFDLYITLAFWHHYIQYNQKYCCSISYKALQKQLGLKFERDADFKRQIQLAIRRVKTFLEMYVLLTNDGITLKCEYHVTK